MAKKAYIGVNGVARNVKNIYIGVNGVARRVTKAYIGVNGVARQFWEVNDKYFRKPSSHANNASTCSYTVSADGKEVTMVANLLKSFSELDAAGYGMTTEAVFAAGTTHTYSYQYKTSNNIRTAMTGLSAMVSGEDFDKYYLEETSYITRSGEFTVSDAGDSRVYLDYWNCTKTDDDTILYIKNFTIDGVVYTFTPL